MSTSPSRHEVVPSARRSGRLNDLEFVRAGRLRGKTAGIDLSMHIPTVSVVVAGRGSYRRDDGPVQAVRGPCLFTVGFGRRFRYGPDAAGWDEYYVKCTGMRIQRWIACGWFPDDGRVHALRGLAAAVPLLDELLVLLARDAPGDHDRAVLACERALVEIDVARAGADAVRDDPIAGAVAYCQAHFREDIDFRSLARRQAMSYSAIRQHLRRAVGMSPVRYLWHLRCAEAKRLLRETDLPVKEIGRRVGVGNPLVFSMAFRRTVGLSPSGYRHDLAARRGSP